jgi:hypothetical protein
VTKKILIVVDSDSESNSSYHVVNVALHLQRLGYEVGVQFSNFTEGVSLDLLNAASIRVSLIGKKQGRIDYLYLWSPRNVQRSLVSYYDFEKLITHIEDNEWLLSDLSGSKNDKDSINEILLKSNLITYVNSNVIGMIPVEVKSFLLLPGVDDFTFFNGDTWISSVSKTAGFYLYAGNVTDFVLEGLTNVGLAINKMNHLNGTNYFLFVTGIDWTGELEARLPHVLLIGNFLKKELVSALMKKSIANLQCGSNKAFDDYRFPSKLPEYLVSGRPLLTEGFDLDFRLMDEVNCLMIKGAAITDWLEAFENLFFMPVNSVKEITSNAHKMASEDLNWFNSVSRLANLIEAL